MSRIVLDMDIPHTCRVCPLCHGYAFDGYICGLTGGEELAYDEESGRPDYCLLKEEEDEAD
jgi:hypothetical protein